MEPTLRRPEIWIPAAAVVLGTQFLAIRNGWSGLTDIYRFARGCRGRFALLGWGVVTLCHGERLGPASLDPYSALSHLIERRDLERARSA